MSISIQSLIKIATKLPSRDSVLLRADHGVGKSRIARKISKEYEKYLKSLKKISSEQKIIFIDRRVSQLMSGDIVGLPDKNEKSTKFLPPDWFLLACEKPYFLFLDELNRALPEVIQAVFQIVLDRQLNGYTLHPLTRVFSAINISSIYNVNDLDPALLDRFWVADVIATIEDWLVWAKEKYDGDDQEELEIKNLFGGFNCHPLIVDFMSDPTIAKAWLDPGKNIDTTKVHPSRRSWEKLGDAIARLDMSEKIDNDFYLTCSGYVGVEAAIKFTDFCKAQDARFSGKQIVNSYSDVRNKILSRNRAETLNEAIEKIVDYMSNNLDELSIEQGQNLLQFMQDIPNELKVSLWEKILAFGKSKINLVKSCQKYLVAEVLDIYGVSIGSVGVTPNIPTL